MNSELEENKKNQEFLRNQLYNADEELFKKEQEKKDLKLNAEKREENILKKLMKTYEAKIADMEKNINQKIEEFKNDILNSI